MLMLTGLRRIIFSLNKLIAGAVAGKVRNKLTDESQRVLSAIKQISR